MQPLKPNEKRAILENRPNAQPADIEEYERLLSERFTVDPDISPAEAPEGAERGLLSAREMRERRIAELHLKLFGNHEAAAASRSSY